jgi:hypothetical protein
MMDKNMKAGSDLHAGDGGYSVGTQEKYDEFVKGRNQSLGKLRIKELEKQCWSHRVDGVLVDGHLHFDSQKFAELIVAKVLDEVATRAFVSGDRAWSDDVDRPWIELEFGYGKLAELKNE